MVDTCLRHSTGIAHHAYYKDNSSTRGATALFAILSQAQPSYILTPIMAGAVILVIIGLLVNNLSPNRNYPRYWY
ncbi:MAG: HPP family protein [Desulfosporosinus sp.]|nr:HPP family protein [Desulfosporosinus sp.]